jgi:hypothetical protein
MGWRLDAGTPVNLSDVKNKKKVPTDSTDCLFPQGTGSALPGRVSLFDRAGAN